MLKSKRQRDRGKIRLGMYFQELKPGEKVAIVREPSLQPRFPMRIQGRTGVIEGKRGRSFIVKVQEYNQEKRFIIAALHLKRLK